MLETMAHIYIEVLTALGIIIIYGTQRDVHVRTHTILRKQINCHIYYSIYILVLMTPTTQLRLPHNTGNTHVMIILGRWLCSCHDVYPAYKYLCIYSEFTSHNWMEIKWVAALTESLNGIFFPGIVNRLKCEFTRATQVFARRLRVRHGRTSILILI